MKKVTKLSLLIVLLLFFGYQVMAQTRGRITNVQAQQRVDGSDIVDVYYKLLGFSDVYIVSAELYHGTTLVGTILEEWCTGDFGPGILPGDNKHFEYNIGLHKPNVEWSKMQIEVRVSFPMGDPCPGLASVSYLGKTYNTIQIGGQCWLKENLDAGTRIDYESLPWLDDEIEKYCYNNDPANCETYGGLYHWWEAMSYGQGLPGARGICPEGFHIPIDYDFTVLANLFGGFTAVGGALKSLDFWESPNTGATNASFFSALGAGTGYNAPGIGGDACIQLEEVSYMWTSSMTAGPDKPAFALYHNMASAALINVAAEPFPFGSVRCMKNCDQQPTASNAGPDQLITTGNYTTLAANTPAYGIGEWVIV
nr:fibrobacter succinogenes major paralogous domain-containing protein [Bacteroidota bacterium]